MSDDQLFSLTWEKAERAYVTSAVTSAQWYLFCYLWQNSAPRFSGLGERFDNEDVRRAWISGGLHAAAEVARRLVQKELAS